MEAGIDKTIANATKLAVNKGRASLSSRQVVYARNA